LKWQADQSLIIAKLAGECLLNAVNRRNKIKVTSQQRDYTGN
jgi:hypothetical protein